MDITPTTIILVGVVCVVLGFLANVLLNTLSGDNETPLPAADEAPPGGRKGRYTPVVRLWRERGSGALIVEMDGKAMVSPEPLNEVQRERLERSARDLRGWLGMGLPGQEPAVSASVPPEPAEVDLTPVKPAPTPEPVKPTPAPQPAAPDKRTTPPPTPRSTTSSSARVTPPPAPGSKGKEEPVAAPASRSIVMQVEDILQDMIAGTALAQRGIHLTEDPARGVIVQVGLDHFEGIDAVPDPEIKGVIRSAVQEWEKSQ
jgi:hypothetical protein